MPKPPITRFANVTTVASPTNNYETINITQLTQEQINAIQDPYLIEGGIVYNLTTKHLQAYENGTWQTLDNNGDVVGPNISAPTHIATFADTEGKVIQDSGISSNNIVQGPLNSVTNRIASFNDNTGKIIKDSGILSTNIVTYTANQSIPADIPIFSDDSGRILSDSGVSIFNVPSVFISDLSRKPLVNVNEIRNLGHIRFNYGTNDIGVIFVDTLMAVEFITNNYFGSHYQVCSLFTGGLPSSSTTPSALVELQTTTGTLLLSRLNNDQIAALTAPVGGMILYNSSNNQFNAYIGSGIPYWGNLFISDSSGNLNMQSHYINNVLNPINPQDAATKNYVDTNIAAGTITLIGDITGSGLLNTSITTTLANTAVTQGTYTYGTFTVNSQGRLTFASNGATPLLVSNNLSDLANAATARINLGLTNIATQTVTQYSVLVGGVSNTIISIGLTNGQLLIGSTGANPVAAVPTNGTNISWTTGAGSLTANLTGQVALANGGTNANLTASNGGIFYSTATAGAILAGTATANQILLSGASGAPSWSTATYPTTTTINQLLYSSTNNVIAGLATANNGVLITSSGGVPSIGSTLPSAVQGNITSVGTIGAGTWNGAGITVPYGGTGVISTTPYSVLCGGTTSTGGLQSVASVGTSGQVLTSQGASALPAWRTPTVGTVTSITAGTNLTGGTITTSGTIALSSTPSGLTSIGVGNLSISGYTISSSANYVGFVNNVGIGNLSSNVQLFIGSTLISGSGSLYGIYCDESIGASTGNILSGAYGIYVTPDVSSNLGTITNSYGIYCDSGSYAGTITNAYGGYFKSPGYGSKSQALYSDNQSIGYTAITPPSNGLIVKGQSVFGSSSPYTSSFLSVNVPSTYAIGINLSGSLIGLYEGTIASPTAIASILTGLNISSSFSALGTATATYYTIQANPTINLNSNNVPGGSYGFYYNPTVATTSSNYILPNSYGIYIDTGTLTGGGSVTNAYGGYFSNPAFGTNKTALYSDNLSVGYTNITPPTNSVVIKNQLAIGTYSPNTGSVLHLKNNINNQYAYGLLGQNIFNPTGFGSEQYQIALLPEFGATSGQTIARAASILVYNYFTSNVGTISNIYGVFVDSGNTASGTITNAYGGYFSNPTVGTYKTALYADNLSIGYSGSNLSVPTNGLIVSGKVGISTPSPYSAIETLYSGLYTSFETSGHGVQTSTGRTTSDYTLYMGGDKTNNVCYIQSVQWGVNTAPLYLNARGGQVKIGGDVLLPTSGGTASNLNYYEEYSLVGSSAGWTSNSGLGSSFNGGTIAVVRIGKAVIFMLKSALTFNLSGSDWVYTYLLPPRFQPSQTMVSNNVSVARSSVTSIGAFVYNTAGYIAFFFTNGASFATGSWTIQPFSVSWTVQ